MNKQTTSIRPFIGAKDYERSRSFYHDFGFEEVVLTKDLSLFKTGELGFYLQNAYVKDWVNNTMIFLEVDDADLCHQSIAASGLTTKYPEVRLIPVKQFDWGKECYLHDPSGILWHIGHFNKP